ncbi:hypothetical protein BDR05DRAFT_954086, partial [Suillus weaverae]
MSVQVMESDIDDEPVMVQSSHRRTNRPGTGTGGRNSQLEKIGNAIQAPARAPGKLKLKNEMVLLATKKGRGKAVPQQLERDLSVIQEVSESSPTAVGPTPALHITDQGSPMSIIMVPLKMLLMVPLKVLLVVPLKVLLTVPLKVLLMSVRDQYSGSSIPILNSAIQWEPSMPITPHCTISHTPPAFSSTTSQHMFVDGTEEGNEDADEEADIKEVDEEVDIEEDVVCLVVARDEGFDDVGVAGMDYDNQNDCTTSRKGEDQHVKSQAPNIWNCHPKSKYARTSNSLSSDDSDDQQDDLEDLNEIENTGKRCHTKKVKGTATNRDTTNVGFYPPLWQKLLDCAKAHFRLHLTISVPFPDKEESISITR